VDGRDIWGLVIVYVWQGLGRGRRRYQGRVQSSCLGNRVDEDWEKKQVCAEKEFYLDTLNLNWKLTHNDSSFLFLLPQECSKTGRNLTHPETETNLSSLELANRKSSKVLKRVLLR
jgi:hypothetical protein